MSYANVMMYGSVLPSYNKDDKKDKEKETEEEDDDVINADDPANQEKIRKLLYE